MRLVIGIALAAAACSTDVRASQPDAQLAPFSADAPLLTLVDASVDAPAPDARANLTPCEEAATHSDIAWIQAKVFNVHCMDGCHDSHNPDGAMDLSAGHARVNLVGVTSAWDPRWKRVVAGNPAESMLMVQIGGEPGPPLTHYMPWNKPRLCDEMIGAIRRWIDQGAQP